MYCVYKDPLHLSYQLYKTISMHQITSERYIDRSISYRIVTGDGAFSLYVPQIMFPRAPARAISPFRPDQLNVFIHTHHTIRSLLGRYIFGDTRHRVIHRIVNWRTHV